MAYPYITEGPGGDREWDADGVKFRQRIISIGPNGTLASADLERGDYLPNANDSTYEIISASVSDTKSGERIATVVGRLDHTTGSATWKEIVGTRRKEDHSPQYLDWVVKFSAAASATPPAVGTTINALAGTTAFGTTGLVEEPRAVSVAWDKITANTAHATVRFRGRYSF